MLSLRTFMQLIVVLNVLAMLPKAAHCDTSYYEKYYSARRFMPPKRAALVEFSFTVHLPADESLARYESLALTGDLKQLGAWQPSKAIKLNRTDEHNVWSGKLQLPMNTSVNYRYFIAAVDNATGGTVQVRRWESHIHARHFETAVLGGERVDKFGWISVQKREVERGWLTAGSRIVQLKFFRNPFDFNEGLLRGNEGLRVRLQPIEPIFLTPLLPSAGAHAEYVRMSYGNSFLRDQPEYGVPYLPNDILIFHTTVTAMEKVGYLLKVYATQPGSEQVRLIGYQYIYPHVLQGSAGNFSVNLISPVWLNSIGSVQLHYLVMAPMPDGNVNFRTSFVNYWRDNWQRLDVGHRGLGKSLTQTTNAAPIIENTVASMLASTELGADMVEFDVMLTSDLVPIISHDYTIYVCMDPKKPTSKEDLTKVYIKDVTYEQLKNLKTYQIVGQKIVEYPAHNNVENEDHRLFPSFEDFLIKINKTVGFDIEIKWPQQRFDGEFESHQTIDKNTYVDRILEVMQRVGCGRLSFFSSFDADICSLLRFKQNMYPVMFLSAKKEQNYADPRSDTIYDVVNNAQAFDLMGVVPNAVFIQQNPKWIEIARKQHKKVFLWGDAIKDTVTIDWFKAQAPEGVIYDRLDLWLPKNKQNVFEMESDLPEFLQLQCSPDAVGGDGGGDGAINGTTTESPLSNVNFL